MTYLFVGVIILWIGILFYMGRLYSQQKKVSRKLDELQ
ncbi:CcmD family protein [Halobacillus amylolyticus]